MKVLHIIAFILILIGGLNWGLIGIFNLNIIEATFSTGAVTSIIYILIGLAALLELFAHRGKCKECSSGSKAKKPAVSESMMNE